MKRIDKMIETAIEKRAQVIARKILLDALKPQHTKRGPRGPYKARKNQ